MLIKSVEQVIFMAQKIKNKRIDYIIKLLKDYDNNFNNKGYVGNILENYFGIKKNNISEPDIRSLGIEIKATPIKKLKNKDVFSLKERMVLNIINFNKENLDDFYQSSFFRKNNKILMFFYIFLKEEQQKNYFIHNFIYHDLLENINKEDLEIIKNDWRIITEKIKNGKAHELSERLTKYLGACPKGNKKITSQVIQPFSGIKAMRRAYSFKAHYLKYLLMRAEYNNKLEKLLLNNQENIVNFISETLKPFTKTSIKDLCERFNVNCKAKHKNYLLLKKIFNVKSFDYVEEFLSENIELRTYTIKENNKIQEEFPFLLVRTKEFENNDISFYDSELYNYFINTKFIFIGFKKDKIGQQFINKVSYFQFPEDRFQDLEKIWNNTKNKFINGVIFKQNKQKEINNLISKKDNYIGHIRPKAKDKNQKYLIPSGQEITRQCYWLNKEFVSEYFEELLELNKKIEGEKNLNCKIKWDTF